MFHYAIADDLTGAAELGMAFFKAHGNTHVWVEPIETHTSSSLRHFSVNLNTRACKTPIQAYIATRQAIESLRLKAVPQRPYPPFIKMDSTWRGYPMAATLAAISETNTHVAILCPAYPKAGRSIEHGHAYLNGTLLHETALAQDPQHPIHTACIKSHLQHELTQLNQKAEVWIDRSTHDALHQLNTFSLSDVETKPSSPPIVWVPNIHTSEDIEELVHAVYQSPWAKRTPPLWIGAVELAHALQAEGNAPSCTGVTFKKRCTPNKPWVVISGSRNPTTCIQLDALRKANPSIPQLDTASWPERTDWVKRLQQEALRFTQQHPQHTMVLCGGDTAMRVLQAHGVHQLQCMGLLNTHCALWQDDTNRHWVLKSGNMGNSSLLVEMCQ
jgi:uncharacterized protein YgbK (DUF1537 family)